MQTASMERSQAYKLGNAELTKNGTNTLIRHEDCE
jgi:hypothetical protein